jgi:hypothetical protein
MLKAATIRNKMNLYIVKTRHGIGFMILPPLVISNQEADLLVERCFSTLTEVSREVGVAAASWLSPSRL